MKRSLFVFVATVSLASAGLNPAVVEAARKGDWKTVRELIAQNVDVKPASADGSTALHWAAYHDDVESARLLLQKGADANAANRYGVRPLSIAATNGSSAMAEVLLAAKADPETTIGDGETALMTASRSGSVGVAKMLLDRGANVNTREKWRGQTALMWAAAEGHADVSQVLMAAGAEKNARSNTGFTPLLFAVREGKSAVVKELLMAGVSPNEALPASVRRGSAGAPHGSTALMLAVTNAHYELAAMLLDSGADPNDGVHGWTALHLISDVRKPGAGSNDPAPPGSGSMTSLELVRKLLAKGARINDRTTRTRAIGMTSLNTQGATPFLLACRTADLELMRELVKLGADPHIATNDKTTPLMAAAGVGTRSPGEDAGTEEESLEAVKYLVGLGANVNAVNTFGDTAVHGVAYKHFPSVAKYLTEHGADLQVWNTKNGHGWTPLRIAVGVHRGMNLRQSPETAEVLRKVMAASGVSTEVEPEAVISGSTK